MATMLSAQRASCFGGAAAPLRAASRSRAPVGARRAVTRSAIKEIFMPALSSTMTEGKIVSWLKSEGDQVTKGDTVVVVESDKADMDVESFFTGWLAVVTVPDGSVAAVGAPIAYIAETKEEIPAAKAKAGGAAPAAAAAPAPAPAAPAPAAAAPPPPPAAAGAPPPPPPPPPAAAAPAAAPARTDGKVFVSPYARKLAKELKVDIDTVRGSGLAGRVTAADVEAAAGRKPAPAAAAAAPAAPKPAVGGAAPPAAPAKAAAAPAKAAAAPVPAGGRTEPLPGMQVAVAKNMLVSLSVPVSRIAMSIETDALDALYAQIKPKGVTMTALLAKAVGVALAAHPLLYATLSADATQVTYNEKVNIAVAVALDGGLITPVLSEASTTDVFQIGRKWKELVAKARSKSLAPAEYNSGNFTISNLGMYGVDAFDAILPPGQGAILAVGASKKTVVPVDGMIGVRTIMTVNLTADHRHINGDKAAEFLQTLKEVIESPSSLVM